MAPARKEHGEGLSVWRNGGKLSFKGAVNAAALIAALTALGTACYGAWGIKQDSSEAKQAVTASVIRLQRLEEKTDDLQNRSIRREQQFDDMVDRLDRLDKKTDELLRRVR